MGETAESGLHYRRWDVIERDIDYLPRWVWSPRFKPGKTKELRLTAAEMRTIVRAAKGYSRKILLVLTVLCKRNGKIRISADRCSKYVGCAWLTANNALKKLTAAELITAQRGKVTYFNDHPVAEAKTYEVHLPAGEQGSASVSIPYPFIPEVFKPFWKDAVGLLTSGEIRKYFTAKEKMELMNK